MPVTYKLTDGTISVDVIAAAGYSMMTGSQAPSLPESAMHGGTRIVERWNLRLRGTDHDNMASQEQTFIKLLRQAREFHETTWRVKPVYLEAQTSGETNKRYALVYGMPEIEHPFGLEPTFQRGNFAEIGVSIEREHPWRSGAPNTLPSALTLTATDGPASPSLVHVANFRDDGNLTHVFSDDGGVFSGNLLSAGSGTALWPAVPAANDALYYGSNDIAFKHVCLTLVQAGNQVWTKALEYWNGANWNTVQTFGVHFTLWQESGAEVASLDAWMNGTAGQRVLSYRPPSDWAITNVNGVAAYWIRERVTAFTSGATIPQKDGTTIYSQRKNYIEVPAAALKGDSPAITLTRLFAPSGPASSLSTTGLNAVSRVLIGARSNPAAAFEPVLNCGNQDNPAAWTTAYGTDTSATSDNEAPGGARATVTFATNSTLISRVQLTGDDILSAYAPGEYRLWIRAQQIGGAAGDTRVSARVFIGAAGTDDPHIDLRTETLRGFDKGPEVLDLGLLQLPFSRAYNSDALTATDLIIHVYATRVTGASTLRIYDVILFPIDEGSVGVDDPVTDSINGSSALRGGSVFDLDNGVLANRNLKYHAEGAALIPAEEWGRFNRPIDFRNTGVKTRLYFLIQQYSAGWETEPLVARLGLHLGVQMRAHFTYMTLRGGD